MDPHRFTRYVIVLHSVPGVSTTDALIDAHVRHLRALDRDGKLVLCGPFTDGRGGMIILHAASEAEADAVARADPFVSSGARTYELRAWLLSCEENAHLGRARGEGALGREVGALE